MKKVFWKKRTARTAAIFSIALLCIIGVAVFMSGGALGLASLAVVPVLAWMKDDKFKSLTVDELKDLDVEDLVKYHEAFQEAKEAEVKSLIEAKADATAIEALKSEIFVELQNQTKELNRALATIAKSQAEKGIIAHDNVKDAISQAKEQIDSYLNGKSSNFTFAVKVDPMTFANSTTGAVIAPYYVPGVNEIRTRNPFIRSLVNTILVGYNQTIYWIEQNATVGGAGTTAEGVAKSDVEYNMEAKSATLVKATIFGTISKEMLSEPFISNFVKNKMMKDLDIYVDGLILADISTGSTAFAAGTLAGTIPSANIYDVIAASVAQANASQFNPTQVWLNPAQLAEIKTTKDLDGGYVVAPFASPNGTMIDGLTVITNTGVTAGEMYVLDPKLVDCFVAEEIIFEMGYNGTDFKQNNKSLLAETKLKTVVQGNNVLGIIKSTIATATAELEKVVA